MDICEAELLESIRKRLLRDYIDILILARLNEVRAMSAYDLLAFFHKKFGVVFSSGTLYSQVYALERQGLVKGNRDSGKRVYSLSEKGIRIAKIIMSLNEKIQCLILDSTISHNKGLL